MHKNKMEYTRKTIKMYKIIRFNLYRKILVTVQGLAGLEKTDGVD